jgi:hypothetical protein
MQLNITIGILLVNILGAKFDWAQLLYISATLTILGILLTAFYVIESPLWLISKDMSRKACNSKVFV